MSKFTEQKSYRSLLTHSHVIADQRMQEWFASGPDRFKQFSLQVGDVFIDYSKNWITRETIKLLCEFARENHLSQKINAMFVGENVNYTEQRPALHTALRDRKTLSLIVNGKNVLAEVHQTLHRMKEFTEAVRNQAWIGATGEPITDIVNIGIGGSHLGPMMAVHALKAYSTKNLRCHFISNIDSLHVNEVLHQIKPETTLFIISSKSFSTLETITNAKNIHAWMQKKFGNRIQKHFVAVTADPERAREFGISDEQIFPLWDWVGGRYSVWSAIGLPLALMIGMDNFNDFLEGAHEMDQHFREAPFEQNMPVLLALLGVWYINFFNASYQAIIPYVHSLNLLPDYLQQLDMESNGKRIDHNGDEVNYNTGPVIFGKHGCDSQHSYFQLLHQGQHLIPVDFVLSSDQELMVAGALTQAQALMQGKSYEQAYNELIEQGVPVQDAKYLAKHKAVPGNRPSNVIFLDKVTPHSLGALLALYEHKIYVQGVLWDINSFDQWGVELGKQLWPEILKEMRHSESKPKHDASTNGLIQYYKKLRLSS